MSQRGRSNKGARDRRLSPSPTRSIRSSRTALEDDELTPNDSISMVSSNRSTRRSEPRKEQSLQKHMFKHRLDRISEDKQDQRSAISRRGDRSELRSKDLESSYSRDSYRSGKDADSVFSRNSYRSGKGSESSYSRDSYRSGKDAKSSHSRGSHRTVKDAESSYSRDSYRSGKDTLRISKDKTEHRSQFSDSNSKAIARHKNKDREYYDDQSDVSISTARPVRRDRDIDDTTSLMSRACLTAAEQQQLILREKQDRAFAEDKARSQYSRSIASSRGRDRSSSTVVTGSSRLDDDAHSSARFSFERGDFKPGDEVQIRTKTRAERTKDGKQVIHKEEDVTVRLGDGSVSGSRNTTALSDTYDGHPVENRVPREFDDDRATSERIELLRELRPLLVDEHDDRRREDTLSHRSGYSSNHHTSSSDTNRSCCYGGGPLVINNFFVPVHRCRGRRRKYSR
jgi:hypothetical protein